MEHTFAICAYKDSPYLEKCIKSIKKQAYKSKIIIITSTPDSYIKNLASKYKIKFFINNEKKGLANDWNFAYRKADTRLVTIAHQDDIYLKDYTENIIKYKNKYKDAALLMTSSRTIKENKLIKNGQIENIKAILRLVLKINIFNHLPILKRLSISFGNPIICPSCCYDKNLCTYPLFNEKYKFVTDWEALLRLSNNKYRWVYIDKALIYYRVHALSTTKLCLEDNTRQKEEKIIFEALWNKSIAKLLLKLYRRSYSAYE